MSKDTKRDLIVGLDIGTSKIVAIVGELDAVIGQDRVDPVRNGFEQVLQKLPSGPPVGLLDQLSDGELAGAVDCHEEIELTFSGLHFGNIHVEEPDRVALEALTLGLVALDVR